MFGCMMFFDMIARQMEGLLEYGRDVSCDAKRVGSVLPFQRAQGLEQHCSVKLTCTAGFIQEPIFFQNSRDVMFQPRHLFPICW